MMFTKFFTVAALATTLTAGAFAMEHEGSDDANEAAFKAGVEAHHELTKAQMDKSHEDLMLGFGSLSGAVSTLMGKLDITTTEIKKYCDGKIPSTTADLKTCMKTIDSQLTSAQKQNLSNGFHYGCISNICGNIKYYRQACGYAGCAFAPKDVTKCLAAKNQTCDDYK
jgi:hypothetical protein